MIFERILTIRGRIARTCDSLGDYTELSGFKVIMMTHDRETQISWRAYHNIHVYSSPLLF